ncbi:glycerophosphoryl diester phosphodiesterase [Bacteroidia bacterium]|nr:glycerophosphoryl diester phosphodiesterase [Bacteroidia bacterium]
MKKLLTIALLLAAVHAGAQTQIIAHRGYWDVEGSAQNSISSLKNAIALGGVYGSEFDVWLAKDGEIILNHDEKYQDVVIETAERKDLEPLRLKNGEPLPTLPQYIEVAKTQDKTKLILEIKSHSTKDADKAVAQAVVKIIDKSGVADRVDYISFSEHICKELIRLNPKHRVAYLSGDKSPQELKQEGYWGLDYNNNVLKKNPTWIKDAKKLGLTTNVWTVNKREDMQYFIEQGVDFITTDDPKLLKELLKIDN